MGSMKLRTHASLVELMTAAEGVCFERTLNVVDCEAAILLRQLWFACFSEQEIL